MYYLPNGVDPAPFEVEAEVRKEARKRLGFSPGDFVFGCISRIDPQKDQASLIDAFAKLAGNNPRVQLVIAGPATSPQYEKLVRDRIATLNLGNRLQLLPAVQAESPQHAGLMATLDTFVLPSRHEPFGIVVLEAWAAGKPVIASDIGGLRKLIDHHHNGLKTPIKDPDSLAEAMQSLVDNPALTKQLAESGRAAMLAEYTWEKINGRQEEIYGLASERASR